MYIDIWFEYIDTQECKAGFVVDFDAFALRNFDFPPRIVQTLSPRTIPP